MLQNGCVTNAFIGIFANNFKYNFHIDENIFYFAVFILQINTIKERTLNFHTLQNYFISYKKWNFNLKCALNSGYQRIVMLTIINT